MSHICCVMVETDQHFVEVSIPTKERPTNIQNGNKRR